MPLYRPGRQIDNTALVARLDAAFAADESGTLEVAVARVMMETSATERRYLVFRLNRTRMRLSEANRIAALTGISLDDIIARAQIFDDTSDTATSSQSPTPPTPHLNHREAA